MPVLVAGSILASQRRMVNSTMRVMGPVQVRGTQRRHLVVSFGPDYAGLAGQVGRTVLAARRAAGVQESGQIPGAYWAPVFLAESWAGTLRWDVADRAGVVAVEEFGPGVTPVPYPQAATPDTPERWP